MTSYPTSDQSPVCHLLPFVNHELEIAYQHLNFKRGIPACRMPNSVTGGCMRNPDAFGSSMPELVLAMHDMANLSRLSWKQPCRSLQHLKIAKCILWAFHGVLQSTCSAGNHHSSICCCSHPCFGATPMVVSRSNWESPGTGVCLLLI